MGFRLLQEAERELEYVIVYRIEGEDVLILHVVRGSRDISGLLDN